MTEFMKEILIVDDDTALLDHLVASLSPYQSLSLKTATNGLEATEILKLKTVDLVITDVQMPEMDGFGLVSHMSQNYPRTPVIIITAHGTPSMEHKFNRMGIVSFEKKPVDIDQLTNRIFDLMVGVDSGYVQGISIPSFLQLLHADRKSCTLKVTDGQEIGYLHLLHGQVRDAEFRDLKGIQAAMEIIGWEAFVTIDIQQVLRLKETTIQEDLTFLIMETLRQKDEEGGEIDSDVANSIDNFILPERNSIPPSVLSNNPQKSCVNNGIAVSEAIATADPSPFEHALQSLFAVKGYSASAILTHEGHPLAVHAKMANTDAVFVAQNIHNMFCSLQEKAAHLNMGPLVESVFRSREGLMLIRCFSEKGKPHIHTIAVFSNLEGEGLMRIRLKRVAEEVAEYAKKLLNS